MQFVYSGQKNLGNTSKNVFFISFGFIGFMESNNNWCSHSLDVVIPSQKFIKARWIDVSLV